MTKPTTKETWQSIGSVARILAGKLVVARELRKMAAAPTGESGGQGGSETITPSIGGKSALTTQGRNVVRASADRGGGALIGGLEARAEFKLETVGNPARAAGGPLQRPAQSLPAKLLRA